MTRTLLGLITWFAACAAHAQVECRTNPQSPELQFSARAGGKTLEFRSRAGGVCVLTLDCTLRGSPEAIDYFVMPQRAGDPPAVWDIRSARFRFVEGGEQSCNVTATSEPRPPLAEPPPFIRRPKKN
ncbi:MAG TPA: hypothetical protein VFX67_08035 [Burkholderiales bacterium]|nr:hypothetical protein [Burkholderiales bacterium]